VEGPRDTDGLGKDLRVEGDVSLLFQILIQELGLETEGGVGIQATATRHPAQKTLEVELVVGLLGPVPGLIPLFLLIEHTEGHLQAVEPVPALVKLVLETPYEQRRPGDRRPFAAEPVTGIGGLDQVQIPFHSRIPLTDLQLPLLLFLGEKRRVRRDQRDQREGQHTAKYSNLLQLLHDAAPSNPWDPWESGVAMCTTRWGKGISMPLASRASLKT